MKNKLAITPRQREILGHLVDLYQENEQHPIHYSTVAEKLGVSKWTAYDLLKVLEEKGLVKSNYELAEEVKGRGRSSVLFSPTGRAAELVDRISEGAFSRGERGRTKQKIMSKLEEIDEVEHRQLLQHILALLPEE